jgi:hypothetical protein
MVTAMNTTDNRPLYLPDFSSLPSQSGIITLLILIPIFKLFSTNCALYSVKNNILDDHIDELP